MEIVPDPRTFLHPVKKPSSNLEKSGATGSIISLGFIFSGNCFRAKALITSPLVFVIMATNTSLPITNVHKSLCNALSSYLKKGFLRLQILPRKREVQQKHSAPNQSSEEINMVELSVEDGYEYVAGVSKSTPSKISFDQVISYIDEVLSAITSKGFRSKTLDSRMKLSDMVEPIASDFSKLCELISQGAKMFSDRKSLTKNISSEAQTVAIDVLKGVGNAHWAAVGLLAIAKVLERLDKISTNDRDCIDLLKGMLDLAKFIKMLNDINVNFHSESLRKMSEALQLIVTGAILCHYFIRCNKISKPYNHDDGRQPQQHSNDRDEMERGEAEISSSEDTAPEFSIPDSSSEPSTTTGMSMDEVQLCSFATELGLQWLPISFTIEELRTATNGFGCVLGRGGFSTVYKGTLSNGRRVAIKRTEVDIKQQGIGSSYTTRAIKNELMCMVNLRHPNIMWFVGFSITGNETMLVYDYMPNGNVSDLIFNPSQTVEWSSRMKIIQGITTALVYLHEGVDVSIVHGDIKPDNILLDENFNAKISDFGSARTLNAIYGNQEVITGTFGYMAPEYQKNGVLTLEGDIYSFGVTLLNVVSGKKCFDRTIDTQMFVLTKLAWRLHKENRLDELIDPLLFDPRGFDSSSILRTIMVALWCTQIEPKRRPSASLVLAMLSSEEKIQPPLLEDDGSLSSSVRGVCSPVHGEEKIHPPSFEDYGSLSSVSDVCSPVHGRDAGLKGKRGLLLGRLRIKWPLIFQ